MRRLAAVCLALLLLCAAGCASAKTEAGNKLKNFKAKTIQGETFDLYQELEKKDLVVIELWFIDCDYCARTLSYMEEISHQYGDRVSFIALNVAKDSDEEMRFYAEKRGFTMPMARDPGVSKAVGSKSCGYPYTVVVGRDATVLYSPFETSEALIDGMTRMIDDMLAMTEEQYQNLSAADLDEYYSALDLDSEEGKQFLLAHHHKYYLYNIRDDMKLTVEGNGLTPVVVDENLDLVEKTELVGQFYVMRSRKEPFTATVETTKVFKAGKAYACTFDPEKSDDVRIPFSKAKRNGNAYVFEIPNTDEPVYFLEKSDTARNRYGSVAFRVFRSKEEASRYFKEIGSKYGYKVTWHLEK